MHARFPRYDGKIRVGYSCCTHPPPPMTISPLSDWDIYHEQCFHPTTSMRGLIGSDTNAWCHRFNWQTEPRHIGKTPECATTTPSLSQSIAPLVVSTPITLSPSRRTPVTSHCWMMSMPISEQARHIPRPPHRGAVPPRGCHSAPKPDSADRGC